MRLLFHVAGLVLLTQCATATVASAVRSDSETTTVRPPSVIDDPEVLRALSARYGERLVVPLVAARSGARIAIIGWPVFSGPNMVVQSDGAVGTTLDMTPEGRYLVVSSGWNPRDRTGRSLLAALEAAQYQPIGQPTGAPLNELAPQIAQLFADFAGATQRHDQPEAVRVIRAMTQLFAWRVTAFDNVLTEMLWAASTGDYTLRHRETVQVHSTLARVTAIVTYHGREIELRVSVIPHAENPGFWLVSSEESPSLNAQSTTQ